MYIKGAHIKDAMVSVLYTRQPAWPSGKALVW